MLPMYSTMVYMLLYDILHGPQPNVLEIQNANLLSVARISYTGGDVVC